MTKALLILFTMCLVGCATRTYPLHKNSEYAGDQTFGSEDSQIRLAVFEYLATNILELRTNSLIFVAAPAPELEALKIRLPGCVIKPFESASGNRQRGIFDTKSKVAGTALEALIITRSETNASAGGVYQNRDPGIFSLELEKRHAWTVIKAERVAMPDTF
jgi:hypothetical protein